MPTQRIYYDDPSARSIEARVTGLEPVDGGTTRVLLDRTPFYPDGGGQPCDTGTIAGLAVRSVLESGDEVAHEVAADASGLAVAGVVVGATVSCVVDLERRNDHSEQHTAQHLVSAVIMRVQGGTTLSFHLGESWSSIDIDLPPMDRADADTIEDEVLRIVMDDYRVTTHLCPPEDAGAFPLRKEPTVESGVLRVVEIDGFEYSACCGTHVTGTGSLCAFRIGKIEKYKGGSRLHFVAGRRAMADWRRLASLARDAASAAGVPEDELPVTVRTSLERIRALEKGLDEAGDRVARLEASSLALADSGGIVFACADCVDAATRLARALAALGRVAVVSSPFDLKAVAASPSAAIQPPADHAAGMDAGTVDAAMDVGATLGPLARARGGKGGGGKTSFQAAFPDRATLDAFIEDSRLA